MHYLRFRSGQVDLRKLRVAADSVIVPGELVWMDEGLARPASEFPWTTNAATTRTAFAAVFAGIAHQGSKAGETMPISVDVSPHAIYEMSVDGGTFAVGDALAPAVEENALVSDRLAKVTDSTHAIGRAAEYHTASSTLLRVQLASALQVGSGNRQSAVG